MLRSIVLPLVLALGAVGFQSPLGTLAASHAAPSRPDAALDDLHDAVSRATMDGALRGALLPILNSARKSFKAVPLAPMIFDIDVDEFDWRDFGVVTGVKDQGQCQADYAFSVTGAVEGAWKLATGALVSLSAQQLIDCVDTNQGCAGGSPVRALEEVETDGIASEFAYPYTATEGACGSFVQTASISDFLRGQPGNETQLQTLVLQGPVSAVLRINTSSWDGYLSGILDPPVKPVLSPRYIAVLIVGFGRQMGTPYWIVKAPYGTGWGMDGYAFIRRGKNAFGITDFVLRPIV